MGLFWGEKRKEDNVLYLCVLGQQNSVNSTLDTWEKEKLQFLSTIDLCDKLHIETGKYRIIEGLEGTLKIIQFHKIRLLRALPRNYGISPGCQVSQWTSSGSGRSRIHSSTPVSDWSQSLSQTKRGVLSAFKGVIFPWEMSPFRGFVFF